MITDRQGRRPKRFPVVIGILIGTLAAAYVTAYRSTHASTHRPDFDHLHAAAQFVLRGRDPYPLIGPANREYYNTWPLYYPLPAVLVIIPLAPLPVDVARAIFVFVVTGLMGYAIAASEGTPWRYTILLSVPFMESIRIAQWSPLFFAMWTVPWLAAVAVVKPNHAFAVLAGRARIRAFILAAVGALALTMVSFLLQPRWMGEWLGTVRSAHHFTAPITRSGGALLLLAALKWRRPEARLLLFLALIPSTPGYYETLVLFLVALTRVEILLLVVLGYLMSTFFVHLPYPSWDALFADYARKTMWLLYLPALGMVLRRPNDGDVPAWLERSLARMRSTWTLGRQSPMPMLHFRGFFR